MRSILGLMVASLCLIGMTVFSWKHLRHAADPVPVQSSKITEKAKQAATAYADAQRAAGIGPAAEPGVTFAGPLATYMSKEGEVAVEKVEAVEYKPTTSDRVGDSVVGTSIPILHSKFHVSVIVDLPFEVPAHAATPKLRGNFRSFIPAGKLPSSDANADVEFQVVNEQEFSNFLNNKPSQALFAADATHNQEVNVSLPPTLDKPTRYHMFFLNSSPKTKKVLDANFRVDF